MKHIRIINGPNLNLLGQREKDIYGEDSFETYLEVLKNKFTDIKISYFQSNHEGAIIDTLHEEEGVDAFILNAGAYTHTSIAIADAIAAISTPVIEVHISNIAKREKFRQQSYLSANCQGTITGFGLKSYELAILSIKN